MKKIRLILMLCAVLVGASACNNVLTDIDDTPSSIQFIRFLCCGLDGRGNVMGPEDPLEYWLDQGATLCVLDSEKQVWLGFWVIEQTWTCYGPRYIFSRRGPKV